MHDFRWYGGRQLLMMMFSSSAAIAIVILDLPQHPRVGGPSLVGRPALQEICVDPTRTSIRACHEPHSFVGHWERWLLVGMDTGSVPTEISSPVCTGPFYPRIRSRSSRGPVLHGGRGLRHRPSDRLFVLRSVDGSDRSERHFRCVQYSIKSVVAANGQAVQMVVTERSFSNESSSRRRVFIEGRLRRFHIWYVVLLWYSWWQATSLLLASVFFFGSVGEDVRSRTSLEVEAGRHNARDLLGSSR